MRQTPLYVLFEGLQSEMKKLIRLKGMSEKVWAAMDDTWRREIIAQQFIRKAFQSEEADEWPELGRHVWVDKNGRELQ